MLQASANNGCSLTILDTVSYNMTVCFSLTLCLSVCLSVCAYVSVSVRTSVYVQRSSADARLTSSRYMYKRHLNVTNTHPHNNQTHCVAQFENSHFTNFKNLNKFANFYEDGTNFISYTFEFVDTV